MNRKGVLIRRVNKKKDLIEGGFWVTIDYSAGQVWRQVLVRGRWMAFLLHSGAGTISIEIIMLLCDDSSHLFPVG